MFARLVVKLNLVYDLAVILSLSKPSVKVSVRSFKRSFEQGPNRTHTSSRHHYTLQCSSETVAWRCNVPVRLYYLRFYYLYYHHHHPFCYRAPCSTIEGPQVGPTLPGPQRVRSRRGVYRDGTIRRNETVTAIPAGTARCFASGCVRHIG